MSDNLQEAAARAAALSGYIILTADQAEAVRGPTAPGAALDPRPLQSGAWALPVRVLLDPAHEMHHALLGDLPVREVPEEEWLIEAEE
ncbi:hypothetical protein EBE87_20280 [Pseudoroseomonas wenyumeiae]|uniref:Uncharacterized protein n=1 Tax=Teichococcus wenyumeiae TaxID=2478470 RepID=A0A3A9JHN9_9PROT|nr:hypothetical protein [Pseudoroseomonas wenyumeiae]RKK04821.1 hypothetical protein D6Z83_07555 [Pseudoroseomonas wenyumeiae]RMI19489.1 hypothetical protein EBE87_20280 [Pseudoroseomonas wenyumeiae]